MKHQLKNFKKGDQVVMFDCMEANASVNYGKLWTCAGDSFQRDSNNSGIEQPEVVFLEGYSGSFWCRYLQLVKIEKPKKSNLIKCLTSLFK